MSTGGRGLWQRRISYQNTDEDGYREAAPIGTFPANGCGLSDVPANGWEWRPDWYRHD